ncbi:methionyl-tRNA synthetase [Planoprotostelium fungivorum]|uniref:methionine--tRNA ligase n=1 Tax=Planoprotostelium fungivorum TaxID=1890364 RepID=A0A2P6NL74_9EUKA|nr:methionyl-tRNA synthetase [Planoprotostelium fungivorum]
MNSLKLQRDQIFEMEPSSARASVSFPPSLVISPPLPSKIVSYILVAEFDIDKGSTITFQYPEATGEDTQLLAELMLPDGVHKRDEDWTVFLLGRGSTTDTKPRKATTKRKDTKHRDIEVYVYQYKDGMPDWELIGNEKYFLHFVYPDSTGASSGVGIRVASKDGNNVLFLARHAAFEVRQLEPSFLCVLSEDDKAIGFRFSGKEQEDIFKKQLKQLLGNTEVETQAGNRHFLYCLNLVINQKDNSFKRGAQVKAMAICTQYQFIDAFKPSIVLALQNFFATPTAATLEEYYNALNKIDLSQMPHHSDRKKQMMRTSAQPQKRLEYTTSLHYNIKLPVKIPTYTFADEVGRHTLIPLIKKFGGQIMIIYNALLTQKRVLFTGFDISASDVCEYVLSACSMVCPPLRGLIKRAFPYTNLTYLDFLSVPGYIAGVMNPMFETHTEWWDILCNITTGKVTLSPALANAPAERYVAYDEKFMSMTPTLVQVNNSVSSHLGDTMVQNLFSEYTQHILDMAFDEEEFVDDIAKKDELEANKSRLEAWKRTMTYDSYVLDKAVREQNNAIRDPMVFRMTRRMRIRKNMDDQETARVCQAFLTGVKDEEQLEEFLSCFPEQSGGLNPFIVGLFHPVESIRIATAKLLRRLDAVQGPTGLVANMNFFMRLAYDRTEPLRSFRSLCRFVSTTSNKKVLITTPIFYVNSSPHIGHLYSTTLADSIARFHRLNGRETLFMTGTDEHGLKVQQAAEKANFASTQDLCDKFSAEFLQAAKSADISFDKFMRTTSPEHRKTVEHMWKKLKENGYIYMDKHEGWYCVSDETFLPEHNTKEVTSTRFPCNLTMEQMDDGKGNKYRISTESGHRVEWVTEENYRFRLSKFKDTITEYMDQNPDWITPSIRSNEVRRYLEDMDDLSVSRARSRTAWGLQVPDDPSQTIYVWLDALNIYLTSTGYPEEGYDRAWPADYQILGKDILRFHAVYWPAFLLAAGLQPPKRLVVHAHWLVNKTKMSKSLGNVIAPRDAIDTFGLDAVRFFLLCEGGLHEDGDFSLDRLYHKLKGELADNYGNLVGRVTSPSICPSGMYPKREDVEKSFREEDGEIVEILRELKSRVGKLYESLKVYESADLPAAVNAAIEGIRIGNRYFTQNEPWKLAKAIKKGEADSQVRSRLDAVVYLTLESIRITTILLQPVMPSTTSKILDRLGVHREERNWEASSYGAEGGHVMNQDPTFKAFQIPENYVLNEDK